MNIELNGSTKSLFILGAGSSVDYGLPTWNKLKELILKYLEKNSEKIKYEIEIKEWLEKVGDDKEHDTIDHCITTESRSKKYKKNGLAIENEIFLAMKEIFESLYHENEDGWINVLNHKILNTPGLEKQIVFIDYNYDYVFDLNLFNFEYLTDKELRVDYRDRIASLDARVSVYYPHGNFYDDADLDFPKNLNRYYHTKKTEVEGILGTVACYESETHQLHKYSSGSINLIILGLGKGLKINLSNINFGTTVGEIHITIRDEGQKDESLDFLQEYFSIERNSIHVYKDCDELLASLAKV